MVIVRSIVKYLAYLYLLFSLVQCMFPFTSQYLRFEDFLFIPAFVYCYYVVQKLKGDLRQFWKIIIFGFLGYLLIEIVNQGDVIYHHLLYLLRILKYGVVFTLTYDLVKTLPTKKTKLLVGSCFLLVAFFNVLIITNVGGIGEVIQYVFTPKYNYLVSNFYEPGTMRLSGTMNNPNDNGVIMMGFLLLFATYQKQYIFAVLAFLLLLLTQSRTALIVCVLSVLSVIVLSTKSVKLSKTKIGTGVVVLFLLFIILKYLNLSYLDDLLSGEAFISYSFVSRWSSFISLFEGDILTILLGKGVVIDQEAVFGTYLDSEYALVLAQFGLLGILIWLLFFGLLLRLGLRSSNLNLPLWAGVIIVFIGIAFTNLTLFHTQIGVFLFFVLGLATFKDKKIEASGNE